MNNEEELSDVFESNKSFGSYEQDEAMELDDDSFSQEVDMMTEKKEPIDQKFNLLKDYSKLEAMNLDSLMGITNTIRSLREQMLVSEEKYAGEKQTYESLVAEKNAALSQYEAMLKMKNDQIKKQEEILTNLNSDLDHLKGQNTDLLQQVDLKSKLLLEEIDKTQRLQLELNKTKYELDLANLNSNKTGLNSQNYDSQLKLLTEQNKKMNEYITSLNADLDRERLNAKNLGIYEFRKSLEDNLKEVLTYFPEESQFSFEKNSIFEFCSLIIHRLRDTKTQLVNIEQQDYPKQIENLTVENENFKDELTKAQQYAKQLEQLNTKYVAQVEEMQSKVSTAEAVSSQVQQLEKERDSYLEMVASKDKIIKELEVLIEIYESELGESKSKADAMQIEPGDQAGSLEALSKESLIIKYNKLKEEWVKLMKDYTEIKTAIAENPGSGDDPAHLIDNLLKTIKELQEANKKLDEDAKIYYEHALKKISELKKTCKVLLGWEVKTKQGFTEMKSVFSANEHDMIVIKANPDDTHEVLESDYTKELFSTHPNLGEIMKVSLPLMFAYANMLLKPEIKDMYFVY